MKAGELLFESLFMPRLLTERLKQKSEQGLAVPAVFTLFGGVLSLLLAVLIVERASGGTGRALFGSLGVFLPLVALLGQTLKLALIHLFAGLWGKRGELKTLWLGLGFSWGPFLLLVPLALILRALGLTELFLLLILLVCVLAWRNELLLIKEVYRLNGRRALALLTLPLALFALLILLTLLALIVLVSGLAITTLGLVL